MAYMLSRLAPGSYDVLLDGQISAILVRSGPSHEATWTLELLADAPSEERPTPFSQVEHTFSSLEEARNWVDDAEIRDPEKA